jgi:hypothetical protein
MWQIGSDGYYEAAEGRSANTRRKPISARDTQGCWTGAALNFLERRKSEVSGGPRSAWVGASPSPQTGTLLPRGGRP